MRPTRLLAGLRVLLIGLACLPPLPAYAQSAARPDSPAVQELMAIPLEQSAADAMVWTEVLETLGLRNEAGALREYLLDAYIRQAAGAPPAAALTIEQGIRAGRSVRTRQAAADARQAWAALLGRGLRVEIARAPVSLPDEIWALRDALTEAAPGLWSYRHADGRLRGLFLSVALRNVGVLPVAFGDFELAPSAPRPTASAEWRCLLPRHAIRKALEAGEHASFLCRAKALPDGPSEVVLARVRQDVAEAGRWTIASSDFDSDGSRLRIAQLLAARHKAVGDAFLARNTDCRRLGTCAQRVSTDPPRASSIAPETPKAKAAPAHDKLVLGLKCLSAMLAYWLIVKNFGPRIAAALIFVGGTIYVIPVVHELWTRNWADLWGGIVVIPLSLALLAAPLILAALSLAAHRFIHDAHYRREVLVGVAVVVAIVALETLSEKL